VKGVTEKGNPSCPEGEGLRVIVLGKEGGGGDPKSKEGRKGRGGLGSLQ